MPASRSAPAERFSVASMAGKLSLDIGTMRVPSWPG